MTYRYSVVSKKTGISFRIYSNAPIPAKILAGLRSRAITGKEGMMKIIYRAKVWSRGVSAGGGGLEDIICRDFPKGSVIEVVVTIEPHTKHPSEAVT